MLAGRSIFKLIVPTQELILCVMVIMSISVYLNYQRSIVMVTFDIQFDTIIFNWKSFSKNVFILMSCLSIIINSSSLLCVIHLDL